MAFSRLQRLTQRTVLAVVVLVAGATAGLAQGKAPVPDTKVQARSQELIRDIYGKNYDAAKTSQQKADLAKKLLDQAAESKGDPGSHFVLLRVAKDVAVLAADAETALDAVNRIVATYDVDAMEMRLGCAKRLASAAKLSSQHGALAAQVYPLVDIAVAEDNFDAASQLGEIARVAAQKARNYPLLKQITARMEKLDEVRKAQAEYQTAVARLEESPTDPQANLAAGRYLCLSRGDWERGIPMLALGSDPALKAPAVKELAGADSPDAQIAAGDAWWDLAQTREGRERNSYLLRAGHWYEQVQPKATSSLMKVRLQDRLEEIAKIEQPTSEATSQLPHPSTRSLPRDRPPRIKRIQGWDPAAAQLLTTLRGHTGAVRGLAFSRDGSTLVSGSEDKTVRLWDMATGKHRATLSGFGGAVNCAAFHPSGSPLVIGSDEKTLRILDTATGRLVRTLACETGVRCVAFSPDGSLLTTGEGNTVKLWGTDARR